MSPRAPRCGAKACLRTCPIASGYSNLKTIGYFESWSPTRDTDERRCAWRIENVNNELLAHVNVAFALIAKDNRIAMMGPNDAELRGQTYFKKRQNRAFKVFIAVGGKAAGGEMFSNMATTRTGRAFIGSRVSSFLRLLGDALVVLSGSSANITHRSLTASQMLNISMSAGVPGFTQG